MKRFVLILIILLTTPAIAEERVFVESYASKSKSSAAPIVKVWSAEVAEKPIFKKRAPAPPILRARFSDFDSEENLDLEVANEVAVSSTEFVLIAGESENVTLQNTTDEELQVEFQLDTDLLLSPHELTLLPGESQAIEVRYIRPKIPREKEYFVSPLRRDIEGALIPVAEDIRIFVQPDDGKAKVAWNRDSAGIHFSNGGNITSKFEDIKICNSGKCKEHKDIYLAPDGTFTLKVALSDSIELVQVVGLNRQSGVIPSAVGDNSPTG